MASEENNVKLMLHEFNVINICLFSYFIQIKE
jgi:hypothetical protein